MNKQLLCIIKKEFFEIFRDKTSLYLILLPLLIFPLLNFGFSAISGDGVWSSKSNVSLVCADSSCDVCSVLNDYISSNDKNIKFIKSKNPYQTLTEKKIDFIINIKSENDIDIIYNSRSCKSLLSAASFGEKFDKFMRKTEKEKNKSFTDINLKNENNLSQETSQLIASVLAPAVFVLMLFQSNTIFSNDMFAGEKERKTFEMLLLSGIKRNIIIIGKVFSLFIIGIINSAVCIISYSLSELMLNKHDFFAFRQFIYLIVLVILICLLISLISSFASLISKSMKQSQMLNELFTAGITVIAVLYSLGFINYNKYHYFIPIVNLIISVTDVFANEISAVNLVICIISNIAVAILFYKMLCCVIKNEKFLL